ncbi:hypothetical protein GF323_03905 [Candidatus Woesearchaeota archaeon]|nr:hypothetical protein [Candidatus Woesearchaeota archaeon]
MFVMTKKEKIYKKPLFLSVMGGRKLIFLLLVMALVSNVISEDSNITNLGQNSALESTKSIQSIPCPITNIALLVSSVACNNQKIDIKLIVYYDVPQDFDAIVEYEIWEDDIRLDDFIDSFKTWESFKDGGTEIFHIFKDIDVSSYENGDPEIYANIIITDPFIGMEICTYTTNTKNIDVENCDCWSGLCCDTANFPYSYYESNDYHICSDPSDIEYRCESSNPGDDVEYRTQKQYCGGGTAQCNGPTSWRIWKTYQDCTIHEYCSNNQCVDCGYHTNYHCLGDDVYWYDDCSYREDLKEDCGSDACTSWSPYCYNNDAWKKRTCYDRYCREGASLGSCQEDSSIETAKVKDCGNNEECMGGVCKIISCYSDADCGNDGYIGSKYCLYGDVHQDYRTYTCSNPGHGDSSCYHFNQPYEIEVCTYGCQNGACIYPSCNSDADCNPDGCYSYEHRDYYCYHPGQVDSACRYLSDGTDRDNDNYDSECGDCNDLNQNINPGASELCNDLDDDCNGATDEGFNNENCRYICRANGYHWSNNGANLNCCGNNPNEASPYEAAESSCSDNHDNDCDGKTDMQDSDCFACNDGDKKPCPMQQGVCQGSYQTCTNNMWPGCTFLNYGQYYESTEISCDARDNDCDANIDEFCQCVVPYGGMQILSDIKFCTGNYKMDGPIFINKSSLNIDCRDTNLIRNYTQSHKATDSGIYLYKQDNIFIGNCNLYDYRWPFHAYDADNIKIINNSFYGSSKKKGVFIKGNNIRVKNNYFSSGYPSLEFRVVDYSSIEDNSFENTGLAVAFTVVHHINQSGNIITNATMGIIMSYTYDLTASQNVITNSTSAVIALNPLFNLRFLNNTISQSNNAIYLNPNPSNELEFKYNNLHNNSVGVLFKRGNNLSFKYNNLKNYINFENRKNKEINLSHNYWGSGDESSIAQNIIDKDDNASYGKAHFRPYYCKPYPTAAISPCPSYLNITLYPGWNLFCLQNKSNLSYSSLFSFDNSKKEYISEPLFEAKKAYWLESKSSQALKMKKTGGGILEFNLTQGWNLLPYLAGQEMAISGSLGNVQGQYRTIFNYNASARNWETYTNASPFNTFRSFRPGKSYWIYLPYNQTWLFNSSSGIFTNPDPFIPKCQPRERRDCGTDMGECRYGTQSCMNGKWGPCLNRIMPVAEICDGLDNDCDGISDNNLHPPSADKQQGVCSGSKKECSGINGWIEPDYSKISSYEHSESSCDGRDNDCDALTDESLSAPACSKQAGICYGSKKTCGGSSGWIDCTAAGYGTDYQSAETKCDQLDNDCDTITDENCNCYNGETRNCGTDIGECRYGTETCDINGNWGSCIGAKGPAPDACPHDGFDNNCNGVVDEKYCSDNYCYDWSYAPPDPYGEFIDTIDYGPYCADKRQWRIKDVDNDGYTEYYMLKGETLRIWGYCIANTLIDPTRKVAAFSDFAATQNIECYDGYCDSSKEYFLWEDHQTAAKNSISFPGYLCEVCDNYGNCMSFGWKAHHLYRFWDTNNNGKLDQGEHTEPYLVLNCGINSDCLPGKTCIKPDINNPTTYYCS